MHFTTALIALVTSQLVVPSTAQKWMSNDALRFEHGLVLENNSTRSLETVKALYPDVDPQILSSHFSIYLGGIYMAGYYFFLGGSSSVSSVIKTCQGLNSVADGLDCANSGFSALGEHCLVALAAGTYGDGTMAWIAQVAKQFATVNPGSDEQTQEAIEEGDVEGKGLEARSYTCPNMYKSIQTSSYWKTAQGIKLSAEKTCGDYSDGDIAYMQRLTAELPSMMQSQGARGVQATFYTDSSISGNVYARIAARILSVQPDNCASTITGSGCDYMGAM